MLAKEIRQYIIVPTLKEIDLYSESAEILVYGTGFVESNWAALVQSGNPKDGGYGLLQDEPIDYNDLISWLNFFTNKLLLSKVLAATGYSVMPGDITRLISDLKLAVICCRLHYYRAKEALPAANDAAGMAAYHVQHYNQGGKANVETNTKIFQRVINGEI